MFAHLLDQHFEVDRSLGAARVKCLGAQCIGFAVEFLHQEVQAPTGGTGRLEHTTYFKNVGAQAVELFGDVTLLGEQHHFLLKARRVEVGLHVGKAVEDLLALGGEHLRYQFTQGLKELKAGREREGAELARLINERLTSIEADVVTLRELVPQMLATQRQKVLDRFTDMKADLDPTRLEQEMVLLAQKSDVAEELDRLSTHILEVRRVLKSGGAAGRRLDFLMQDLNREANTLGSKAFDPRSTTAAVNLKVLIEQMREQVQNIE